MADNYGIGDDALDPYQAPPDTSEHEAAQTEYVESESYVDRTKGKRTTTSGNEEWQKHHQPKDKDKKDTPKERLDKMSKAIKGFRVASSGDGLVRASFGKLPDNPGSLAEQMASIQLAILQFHLSGDNVNVSGSFEDGYTISRQNPCDDQQVNQGPI